MTFGSPSFFFMATTQIDSQAKANIDRIERRKMQGLKRVQRLPERGGLNEWVLMLETHTIGEEEVEIEQPYVWLENEWIPIGGLGDFLNKDTDTNFLGEI